MAAVAARSNAEVQRETDAGEVRTTRRVVRRRRRTSALSSPKSFFVMMGMVLVVGLCFVNTYAHITVTGYNRDQLTNTYNEEKQKNEDLKVQWNLLSSPHNVVASAEKSGMIYAKDYDYLGKPKSIASVPQSVKD